MLMLFFRVVTPYGFVVRHGRFGGTDSFRNVSIYKSTRRFNAKDQLGHFHRCKTSRLTHKSLFYSIWRVLGLVSHQKMLQCGRIWIHSPFRKSSPFFDLTVWARFVPPETEQHKVTKAWSSRHTDTLRRQHNEQPWCCEDTNLCWNPQVQVLRYSHSETDMVVPNNTAVSHTDTVTQQLSS
jgi:hypothetical protein